MSRNLAETLEAHRTELMSIPGVQGVAVGLSPTEAGAKRILVYATVPVDIADDLDGHPVEVVLTKGFRAEP